MYGAEGYAAAGIIAGMAAGIVVAAIAYYVVYIIAFWKIFQKAGEEGWKSIIPVYNIYTQFKITWDVKFFWATLILCVVGGVLEGIGDSGSILYSVGALCVLVGCIFVLIDYYYLSKSFGHGAGYFIGLIFFEWLFTLIIGFGSSQYIGNTTKNQLNR